MRANARGAALAIMEESIRSVSSRALRAVVLSIALAASHAHAAETPKFVVDVPFKPCEGLVCIDVSLDGAAPRALMLDTGNPHSTLLADPAHELGWTLAPTQRNGEAVAGIWLGGEHRVGLGDDVASATFWVFDRALLGKYQPPVDGSLAYDFFKDRVLEIDYARHRVRYTKPIATPVPDARPEGLGSLKLITFGDHGPPIVVGTPFTVNGKNVRAQIDTVFTGTMLIYDSALDSLGLHKEGTPELFRYTDGGVNLLAGRSDSIGFGKRGLVGGAHTLYFVGEGPNPVHQPDGLFEATVGNALFAHSVVTLDFHAMTIDVRTAD
jgi:hypothetical protein